MFERERMINFKPLVAYESMQPDIHVKQIPGFNQTDEKNNSRRYNRKGMSNALFGH
jgi:hypothetical protein